MLDIGTLQGTIKIEDAFSASFAAFQADLTKSADAFGAYGAQMVQAGAVMSIGITAPLTALAKAAIDAGSEFEGALNQIDGVLGPTQDQMEQVRATAIKMGADTVFSATDAANAMLELGKAGFDTDTAIGSVGDVLQLAAASGLNMAESATMAARTLNAFGLQAKDLSHVNDVLAKAVNTTSLDIRDLQIAFNYVGPVAQGFGLTIEQTSAALGIMRDSGIAAETTGRALREGMSRLANPVKAVRDVVADLGLSLDQVNPETHNFSEIIGTLQDHGMTAAQSLKLFGDVAGPGMFALVTKGQGALDELTKQLQNSGGAAAAMADKMMQGLPGAMEQLRGSVETAMIAVEKAIEPAAILVIKVLGAVADLVTNVVVPAFEALPTPIQVVVLGIAAVGAAAGPVLLAVGGLSVGLSTLGTAFVAVTGLVTANTAVLATNEAAVASNAAVTTASAQAIKFAAGEQMAFNFMVNEGAQMMLPLSGAIEQTTAATTGAAAAAEVAAAGFAGMATTVLGVVAVIGLLGAAWASYKDDWTRVFDLVIPGLGGFRDAIDAIRHPTDQVSQVMADLATVIGDGIGRVIPQLQADFDFFIQTPIVAFFDDVATVARTVGQSFADVANIALADLKSAMGIENFNPFAGMMDSLIQKAKDWAAALHDAAQEARNAAGNKDVNPVSGAANAAGLSGIHGLTASDQMMAFVNKDLVDKTNAAIDALGKEYQIITRRKAAVEDATVIEGKFAAEVADTTKAYNALTAANKADIAFAQKHGYSIKEIAEGYGLNENAVKMYEDALKKATEATKKHEQDTAKADAAAKKFADSVKTVDFGKWISGAHGVSTFLASMPREVSDTATQLAKMNASMRDLPSQAMADVAGMWVPFKKGVADSSDEIEKLRKEWQKTQEELVDKSFIGGMSDGLGKLSQSFSQLSQIMGDKFKGAIQDIGQIIGAADIGAKAGEQFLKGFQKATSGGGAAAIMEGMMGMVSGITTGIGGLMSSTGGGSLAKSLLGGASSGAMLGASVGAAIGAGITGSMTTGLAVGGPWGALAGVAVGLIVGYFRGKAVRDEMARVGREWGVSISEGLADTINVDAKSMFRGSEQASEIFHLKDIMAEGGGLSADPSKWLGKLRDVFVMLGTGQMTAAQATTVLDDNFSEFAEHFTTKTGLLSRNMREIIDLTKSAGLDVASINDYIKGQLTTASEGFQTFLQPVEDAKKGLADNQAKVDDLKKQMAGASGSQQADLQRQIDQTNAAMTAQQGIISALGITTQDQAAGAGAALAGMFQGLQDSGSTIIEALQQVQPAAETLQAQLASVGLSGGEAFDQITRYAALANDAVAGPVLSAVEGLNKSMVGLNNSGLLTQEMFTGFSSQVSQAFNSLVSQGKNGDDVLRMMAPTLRTLASLQSNFGFTVDDATQALIDQGIQAGIVGGDYLTENEKQLKATKDLTEAMNRVASVLGGDIPRAADTATDHVGKVGKAITDLPSQKTVTINVDTNSADVPMMASGGVVNRPTLLVAGEAGPEAIVPLGKMHQYAGDMHPATMEGRTQETYVIQVDARGAYLDDYYGQQRLADRLGTAVANRSELSRRATSFTGVR